MLEIIHYAEYYVHLSAAMAYRNSAFVGTGWGSDVDFEDDLFYSVSWS